MKKTLEEQICIILKKYVKGAGYSYKDLAVYLDVSEISIKRLMNNQQAFSMQRLLSISDLLNIPFSKVVKEAEENIQGIALYTESQDNAFCNNPSLYSFLVEIMEGNSACDIAEKHQIDKHSIYLYLRELERLGLVRMTSNNSCSLLIKKHTAFAVGSKFPNYFKHKVISRLYKRTSNIEKHDQNAFFLMVKTSLTPTQFKEINHKLEEWLFGEMCDNQSSAELAPNSKEYTFAMMAAQGVFHDDLPPITAMKTTPVS